MVDDNLSTELDSAFAEIPPDDDPQTPAEPAVTPEPAAVAEPEVAAEPAPPEATTEPATAETEPAAAEPELVVEDPAEAALSLTPEELAEIKANPATAKLYKSLMRASTSKFQEISADKRILQAMRENPRSVIEAAARNMGLVVSEVKDPAAETGKVAIVDGVMDDMTNLFGPELAPTIRPVMERLVKSLVDKEVTPIRERQAQDIKDAQDRQSKAHAQTFRAKHPDLSPEVEAKIVTIGKTVFPAEGTDPGAYLDMLYTLATAGNTARATAKVAAERIKAAQTTAEPRRGAAPVAAAGSLITENMTLDQAFDAAWAQAKAEQK